jgi:hypothetical protein
MQGELPTYPKAVDPPLVFERAVANDGVTSFLVLLLLVFIVVDWGRKEGPDPSKSQRRAQNLIGAHVRVLLTFIRSDAGDVADLHDTDAVLTGLLRLCRHRL